MPSLKQREKDVIYERGDLRCINNSITNVIKNSDVLVIMTWPDVDVIKNIIKIAGSSKILKKEKNLQIKILG